MENRIDDQSGGREENAARSHVPNRLLERLRSGAWWRVVAEHYGPSAAKVSSTLAFAFAIGIGLGVVLASGLDDSTDYDHARAHASEPSDVTSTTARKAQPEPPYAIEVTVRESAAEPAAAPIGDIFADIPPESVPPKALKMSADEGAAETEAKSSAVPEATQDSVVVKPVEDAEPKKAMPAEPKPQPVATKTVVQSPQDSKRLSGKSKEMKPAALDVAPTASLAEKAVDVAVTASLPFEENDTTVVIRDDETNGTVLGTDESINVADDTSAGGGHAHASALNGRQLAALPGPRDATWLRHAVRTPREPGKAMIAIVIDDLGIDLKRTRRAMAMPGPMTMSFIPYGYKLAQLTKTARAGGHEILLHLPMEPLRRSVDPGPHALLTTLSAEVLRQRLVWNLARMEGYVGINNHMGSRFTAWRPGMRIVMREIRERGLLFLDSWTNKKSYGIKMARENGVPSAVRDVFIDHDIDAASIGKRLRQLESIARRRGYAIGIGHPYDLTTKLIPAWMAGAKERGIQFVPISTIVRRGMSAG
jgi:polysaccharide deacetylase 2 family uncharacterized protein YibQ